MFPIVWNCVISILSGLQIIYAAPMKALCTEMTRTFSQRLAPFGVKVRELTGEMQLTRREIAETQVRFVYLTS